MTKVKFGLRIPAFPVDGSTGKAFINQVTQFINELKQDFSSAWVCDHFVPWANFVSETAPNLEGFTSVAYLSGMFQNLTFGNIVLCNSYRNPALLAKMAATLQALTGGRFVLGIGAGWKQDEYVAYGYPFPPPKVRIQQLEEAVQIIKKMWTKEKATFKGRYYQIEEAVCSPKPEPVPPLMIGGGGEKMTLKVVARHADWWNLPNVSPSIYQQKLDRVRRLLARGDRSRVVAELGNSIEAFNSVPTAIYSFLAEPGSFAGAVLLAVSFGGDTDTIGAMTGAISGACLGVDSIPAGWRGKLENVAYIEDLADKLYTIYRDIAKKG